MANNLFHKSVANSTLYNVEMKGLPLLSHTFIWTSPVCFDVKKLPSATSIYLIIPNNETGIKYEIYGVMRQVAPESKIQLVSCHLSS